MPDASFLLSTFFLGDVILGIDTLRVQEIGAMGRLTRVYNAPDYVEGLINLRGRVVTVIDPAVRLGLQHSGDAKDRRIIIINLDDEAVGLVVDSVSEVLSVDREEVMPFPASGHEAGSNSFRGVLRHGENLVTILDVDEVLSTADGL